MFKTLKVTTASAILALGLVASPAFADPMISGAFSISGPVTAPLPGPPIDLATGIDFGAGTASNSCTGDFLTVLTGTCGGAVPTVLDLPSPTITGTGAVAIAYPLPGWLSLSLGGVSFDLLSITNIGRSGVGIPSLEIKGSGIFHMTGYAPTPGFYTLTAQGTPGSFSYSASLLAVPSRVPEPGSLALIGIALAGLGFTSRRRKQA